MTKIERFVCPDGYTRWARVHERSERRESKELEIPQEVKDFEELFEKISEQVIGERLYFCRKGWTLKKIKLILTILENLSAHKVEAELFLLSAFSRVREEPRAIWPSFLSSLKSIKKYQDWISSFASKKEARRQLHPMTLEEILIQNHKKYLYYHDQIGWSDEIIFRTKAVEFDPFYLMSVPKFLEEYERCPEALRSVRGKLEEAITVLESDVFAAKQFWETIGRIKCQTQQINSTSSSRVRSLQS